MADVFQVFFGDRRRVSDRGGCRSTPMCFRNLHLRELTLASSHHVITVNKKAQADQVTLAWLTEGRARSEIKLMAPELGSSSSYQASKFPVRTI